MVSKRDRCYIFYPTKSCILPFAFSLLNSRILFSVVEEEEEEEEGASSHV